MSDKIPGSSWSNPIIYKDWIIAVNSMWPHDQFAYTYTHKDYDGDEDNRYGFGATIEACKQEIDDYENEQT